MDLKHCKGCHQNLPVDAFELDRRGYGDGLRHRCKACRRQENESYKQRTGFSSAAWHKAWRSVPGTLERERQKARDYRAARRAQEGDRYRRWSLKNSARLNAKRMAYEARKLSATPAWANAQYITIWYEIAKQEQARTGRACQVDHIVPLKSPRVCGLHCEHNLQVLFLEDNAAKSNRIWPDAP